jgi:hypothetical protein
VQTWKPRPAVGLNPGEPGRGWERVDGEHKVDVGWLKDALVAASQKGMPEVDCGAEDEEWRGEGGQEEEVVEQFPNSVQKVFGGDSSSINGPLPSTRSNTWNSGD